MQVKWKFSSCTKGDHSKTIYYFPIWPCYVVKSWFRSTLLDALKIWFTTILKPKNTKRSQKDSFYVCKTCFESVFVRWWILQKKNQTKLKIRHDIRSSLKKNLLLDETQMRMKILLLASRSFSFVLVEE